MKGANTAKKTTKPSTSKPRAKNAPANKVEGKTVVATGAKENAIYYIVYVDTYVTDTDILAKGVYVTDEAIERLDASSSTFVRKFEGAIPDKIVHEIAGALKISLEDADGNYRATDEILDEIVLEI